MSLKAEIARVQLNSLPPSIAARLLKRRDVAALIEAGAAEVGGVGQFRFADVRNTLATAPMDVLSAVPSTATGEGIAVARSPDGMCRVRGSSGAETTLPELSLLDPSAQVRLEGIRRLSERANPSWPRVLDWQSIATEGPLADSDFGLVLDELQGVAEHVIAGIVSKIERGQFSVFDVIPTSRTYYESLLGQVPVTAVAPYVGEVLRPHLRTIFRKSATWGLRCVQATCISEAVDPTVAAADVSNDDLLSAIQSISNGGTPSALSATHRLASSRARQDPRFLPIAQQALETLFQRACTPDSQPGLDALYVALVRLTLGIVGQSDELAAAPPFWRRLAAFTHATLLLETVRLTDAAAAEIAAWCVQRLTQRTVAVEILDHLLEPGWRSDALNAEEHWASALLRALQRTDEGAEPPAALSEAQIEQAQPKLLLVAGLPDPLNGARRDWSAHGVEVKDQDLLNGVDAPGEGGDPPTSAQIWNALAHHAQIYSFNDRLLERVRGLASNLKPQTLVAFTEIYAPLALCCNVAATQADLELADLAVSVVLGVCEGFTHQSEGALAASIVILAAGASEDPSFGMQWAGEKLLALAYRMPRGPCCDGLAQTIATFQRLIPLSRRRWGKALIVASSATD